MNFRRCCISRSSVESVELLCGRARRHARPSLMSSHQGSRRSKASSWPCDRFCPYAELGKPERGAAPVSQLWSTAHMNANVQTALIATVFFTSVTLSTPSRAETTIIGPTEAPSRVVRYADLNLATPEGVRALYSRIQV